MNGWIAARAIAAKDLRIERRSRTGLQTAMLFVVLVQLIVVYSRDPGAVTLRALAPGVLWITIALASLMVLSRIFLLEREEASIELLLLAPVPRVWLFLGKLLGNLALVGMVALVAFPIWVLFFNLPIGAELWSILLLLLLVLIALGSVGTLFAALAVRTRSADLLLPVLLLPAMLPPVSFAAQATVRILQSGSLYGLGSSIRLLLLFDLGYLLMTTILFSSVVDE